MTAALTPSAMSADLALRQRIEARLDRRMPPEVRQAPKFEPALRQADAIGACQVINRYRYHGPILRRAMSVCEFFGGGSMPALVVAIGLSALVMGAMP